MGASDFSEHAVRRLWPDRVERVTGVEFEWSPGRWDSRYLDNGTAADVALFHTTPARGRGIIFVETKYHENLRGKDNRMKPRYLEVAQAAGAFAPGSVRVLGTGSLQQIWFDHLLALATREADGLESALFVLAYPEINVRCRDAATRYAALLDPTAASTFEARTLEDLVTHFAEVLHDAWIDAFTLRYLTSTEPRL